MVESCNILNNFQTYPSCCNNPYPENYGVFCCLYEPTYSSSAGTGRLLNKCCSQTFSISLNNNSTYNYLCRCFCICSNADGSSYDWWQLFSRAWINSCVNSIYLVTCYYDYPNCTICDYERLWSIKDYSESQTILDPSGVLNYLAISYS
jgi:hypothetical protein